MKYKATFGFCGLIRSYMYLNFNTGGTTYPVSIVKLSKSSFNSTTLLNFPAPEDRGEGDNEGPEPFAPQPPEQGREHDEEQNPHGGNPNGDEQFLARIAELERDNAALVRTISNLQAEIPVDNGIVANDMFSVVDIRMDNMDIHNDTLIMISDYIKDFEHVVSIDNRYAFANVDLNHFKTIKDAEIVQRSGEMYMKWFKSKELYGIYLQACYRVFADVQPMAFRYLKEVQMVVSSNATMLVSPLFHMDPDAPYSASKAIYGLVHGLHDLHHFVSSQYNEIVLECNYDTKVGSEIKGFKIDIDFRDGKATSIPREVFSDLRVYDLQENPPLHACYDAETMFLKSTHVSCLLSLYEFFGSASCSYINESATERMGYSFKTGDDMMFKDGFRIQTTVTEGLFVSTFDESLLDQVTCLFMLDKKLDVDDIIRYICTGIYYHMNSMVKQVVSSNIVSFKFKINIKRKIVNNELRSKYIHFVDHGAIAPLSPLQILFYLKDINWEVWHEYILYSSVVNTRVNPKLNTCKPRSSSINKSNIARYSRQRSEILSTLYYEVPTSLLRLLNRQAKIDFKTFMMELLARTVIKEGLPDYMYPISAGYWKGSGGSSMIVNPATLNLVMCKFSLLDDRDVLDEFIQRVTYTYPGIKPPMHLKSATRLTEFFPNILVHFLPSCDIAFHDIKRTIDEFDADSFFIELDETIGTTKEEVTDDTKVKTETKVELKVSSNPVNLKSEVPS